MMRHPAELSRLLNIPFSDEQLAAATAPLSPQLIVAGAGTGKTTVMAARVVWLVGNGFLPAGRVLGLTFTNKAAGELRQRIRQGLGRLPRRPGDDLDASVLTYHAFANQVLKEFGALVGVEDDAQLLTDAQRSRLAYRVACEPHDATGLSGSLEYLANEILQMDDDLAELGVETADLRKHDLALLELMSTAQGPASIRARIVAAAESRIRTSKLVDQFRESKSAGQYVDFADAMRLVANLAGGVPSVRERLRERFGVVLLDEYQDTSRVQRLFLQQLFGDGHPITAVGDPCQAIYGWRGASVTNIDEFPRHFPQPDGEKAETYQLTINRRSGEQVLVAANSVAAELREMHRQVRPLRSSHGAPTAQLRCALLPSYDDELAWLGEQISERIVHQDPAEIAVLCRKNEQVMAVTETLRERGITVQPASKQDLLAAPEVIWVTSLLQILVDPFANPELVHHLTGPRWRIGPRDLAILGRRATALSSETEVAAQRDLSLLDAVADPGPENVFGFSRSARERFADFLEELDQLGQLRDRPVVEVVAEIIELLAPLLLPPGDGQLPPSLLGLLELARGFRSLSGGRSLPEFTTYLNDCRRFKQRPDAAAAPRAGGVRVMTVHAAKGLEFPTVFLPFLTQHVFPSSQSSSRWPTSAAGTPPIAEDEPDAARSLGFPGSEFSTKDSEAYRDLCREQDRLEEDRLAYVAITRAETALIASGHWWGTRKEPQGPSPYLTRIRKACEQTDGKMDEWHDEPGDDPRIAQRELESLTWPGTAVESDALTFAEEIENALTVEGDDLLAGPWHQQISDVLELRRAEGEVSATVELPEVMSVSQLLRWRKDSERFLKDLARPMPIRPSAAAERGTRFHAYVEERMGQQELFDLADWIGDQEQFAERQQFEHLFSQTRFADKKPIAVEHPFVLNIGSAVLTGRIDAVFHCEEADFDWEVVDWKTGSLDRADEVQLAIYRAAWAAHTGTSPDRIRGAFVQLNDGSERIFSELPDVEAVTDLGV